MRPKLIQLNKITGYIKLFFENTIQWVCARVTNYICIKKKIVYWERTIMKNLECYSIKLLKIIKG